jgi:hypothetical protein
VSDTTTSPTCPADVLTRRSRGGLNGYHPTHLRIFTTFFRVVAGLDKLRLYHEVSVSDGRHQLYEYINCHAQTGMMRDAKTNGHA